METIKYEFPLRFLDRFEVDSNNALHSFDHADGKYHLMGCILSAASFNKWWMENILETKDYIKEQDRTNKLGENSVYFLPWRFCLARAIIPVLSEPVFQLTLIHFDFA